jgi:nicotinate-nucleotide adenylyltransferase
MDYIDNLNLKKDKKKIIKSLDDLVSKELSKELYLHSAATLKYAAFLSDLYELKEDDYYKICVASILHDYGKKLNIEDQRKISFENKNEIKANLNDFRINAILHGFCGSVLVKNELGIYDKKIIESIKYHTVGRVNMSMVEKIVYISDKIEDGRKYEDIDYLREISLKNINLCLLEVYKNNIIYIIKRNKSIYSRTFNIWNNICRLYGGF